MNYGTHAYHQLRKYRDAITAMPPSGGGGCHVALLGVATRGFLAGMGTEQIFRDLRAAVHGSRPVSDSEIEQAIRKAGNTDFKANRQKRLVPAIKGDDLRQRIIRKGNGATAADFWEASKVRIGWPPEEDSRRVLEHLYKPDEILFIGDDGLSGVLGQTVRPVSRWIEYFTKHGASPWPKIMPNGLTGCEGQTKEGKPSYRTDACITSFRFVVCEFDTVPLADQFAFWYSVKLPVAAIIHSGKKSLHAWVRVDCADAAEWESEIEAKLFPMVLKPLGMDSACKNESRLSRMPGHLRDGNTMTPQRLLYLAPEGRPVHA